MKVAQGGVIQIYFFLKKSWDFYGHSRKKKNWRANDRTESKQNWIPNHCITKYQMMSFFLEDMGYSFVLKCSMKVRDLDSNWK